MSTMAIKGMLGALTVLTAGTLAAQTTTFNTLADWNCQPKQNVTMADGIFKVTGSTNMMTVKKFDVDPSRTYVLKATAKTDGTEKSMFYFGFNQFDKNGRNIPCISAAIVAQTDTELVAPAKKGDTSIKVKDGSKWRVNQWFGFAYNTDPSFSDLPNFNIAQCPVKEVKQEGEAWLLTFSKPLMVDLASGTKVRQHANGGYMYSGGYGQLTGTWKTFSGSAKDIAKSGFNYVKFAPGTAKVQVIMLVNWGNKNATAEVKDISLEVK